MWAKVSQKAENGKWLGGSASQQRLFLFLEMVTRVFKVIAVSDFVSILVWLVDFGFCFPLGENKSDPNLNLNRISKFNF